MNAPVESDGPSLNPYASPTIAAEERPPDWYLASACRHFKGIGWASIVYVACVTPVALRAMLVRKPPGMGGALAMLSMMILTVSFFALMIRTASLLSQGVERLHRRARWLGILAAAFGFPLLTAPAFVAVSRLAKYREMNACAGHAPAARAIPAEDGMATIKI